MGADGGSDMMVVRITVAVTVDIIDVAIAVDIAVVAAAVGLDTSDSSAPVRFVHSC